MKRRRMPLMNDSVVNVTPLIDIVMVLVVFFMLVAKIGVNTGAEPMPLPSSISGIKISDLGNTLTLNLHYQNLLQTQVTTLVSGELTDVPLAGPNGTTPLVDLLKSLHAHNPNFKVILRAPKEMPYSYLEPVLQACAQAGVPNVNFTTEVMMEAR